MLEGKTVYVVVTGAHRTTTVAVFLDMLKNGGASTIVLMPTPAAVPFIDFETIASDVIVRYDSKGTMEIPEEDVVVVAPCTFNTFSKIACGIADNYAMSILHAAIGKKKPVIIAPSMGGQYWWHPLTSKNRETIAEFAVEVVWPEYVYNSSGELEKVTMAPWEKIFDSVCHKFGKLRYKGHKVEEDVTELIKSVYPEFDKYGSILQRDHYTNAKAGFLAMKKDGKIVITRTGAFVGNLSEGDLTCIVKHEGRDVYWTGGGEPSSETPLVLDIFDKNPDANVVIHGHCRDITYSPKMLDYLSEEYLSYGQWGEYVKIAQLLEKHSFAIMKLHGEIVIGDSFESALALYREMYEKTC